MAKKRVKKPPKQEELASPPKAEPEDPVPALPEAVPTLSKPATESKPEPTILESKPEPAVPESKIEPGTTESKPDASVEISAPTVSKVENPVVEVPTIRPASKNSTAGNVKTIEQEQEAEVAVEEKVETVPITEPVIKGKITRQPAEKATISQGTTDTKSTLEPLAQSGPSLLSRDPTPSTVHHEPEPTVAKKPETRESAPLKPRDAESSTARLTAPGNVEAASERQSEPLEALEEPISVAKPSSEPPKTLEEPIAVEEPSSEPPKTLEEPIAAEEPSSELPKTLEEPLAVPEPPPEPPKTLEKPLAVPEPQSELPKTLEEPLTVSKPPSEPVRKAVASALEQEFRPEPIEHFVEPVVEPAPQVETVKAVEVPTVAPEPEPELESEQIPELENRTPQEPQSGPEEGLEPDPKPESPATVRPTSPARSTISSASRTVELKLEPAPESIHAPSPKRSQTHPALSAPDEQSAPSPPPPVERKLAPEFCERPAEATRRPVSPPRPLPVAKVVEDDRPPAPTPPVGRYRPRNSIAFDSDDDDDLALIQPRLRGDRPDPARVATYPPQSSHPRSLFASRVPAEHYSPPPPQAAPPGYHPRYYPPAAPHYPPAAPQYQQHPYTMSQNGGYPNPGSYGPPSHGSSPYQESWGQFPPTYPPYGSPQRQDSIGSREYPMGPPSLENGSSAVEDDTGDVFSRIAQAIPDLHVLLAKYKETHGQLGVREDLLRRAGIEQQEKLRNKDEEIYHLKGKMSQMETKHSSDASRLRLEIGNMEEQMKELREQIAETERFKKEAEETRLALDAAKASWEARCKDLQDANALLEKTALEEREKAQREFDDWRSTANTRHDAEKIALAIQFDKKLKEADVLADKQRQEAAASFVKEKDELRSEHQRQQRERESNYDKVRKELETKLSTAQRDREDSLIHERESREVWEAERETLAKVHEEDRESLQRGWDEQREFLEGQYRKNKEESDKAWIELHADASRKAEEEKAKVERLMKEKEELLREYNALKAESQREKEVIKSVAGNLESERARLEKLMECYGDIAEIKSKGDTYYSVSFSQLQRQIVDLATTHFVHLPVSPPPEDLAQIPSGLPSFLGDTIASRQLRSAYVAHTVAKMITYRVFGPFLFSLGRRYDKADSLFSSMSNHIRDKSTRKEAIWRQQTLLAAFTSSGAKQRINTAAGTVVDEIIVAIKNFADPKEEEGIKIAVKRIVKLAAETWRFARLEREMITATMPALQDEEHKFTGLEYWPPFRPEGTPIPSLVGTAEPSDEPSDEPSNEPPKLLLRLFPVIYREPKHENFQSADKEGADTGCIYHHGLALYDDAEPVVKRSEELKHAGLPPVANPSPTAADFPPPMIPPPRNALPPTPGVPNEALVKSPTPPSENPPPPTVDLSEKASMISTSSSVAPSAPLEYSRRLVPMSDLSIPPYKPQSETGSIKSTTAPTPPVKPSAMKRTTLPPMSDLSIPPYVPQSERASIKSTSPPPSAMKRHHLPPMSDLSIPPYIPRSEKASIVSSTPPPSEALPSPDAPLESPHSPALTMFDLASRPYTRPVPGQVNYSNSRDVPPLPAPTETGNTDVSPRPTNSSADSPPAPTESADTSAPSQSKKPDEPPLSSPTGSVHTTAPSRRSKIPPLPAPTDLSTPATRPYTRDLPRPPIPVAMDLSLMDDESAIIPPLFSRRNSTISSSVKENSTPTPSAPGSRAVTPPSPLYPAEDEIDALATHRSRNPSATNSRRSTPARTSNEELRKETIRRTSGYAISNRSSLEGSVRTERTDRTDRTERSGMSSNSRYMCESRSAAIKGLYPNSPMAGTPVLSRTNSLRSSGKRSVADKTESGTGTNGTWDTSTASGNENKESNAGS